jgi:hypothetical protein
VQLRHNSLGGLCEMMICTQCCVNSTELGLFAALEVCLQLAVVVALAVTGRGWLRWQVMILMQNSAIAACRLKIIILLLFWMMAIST